MNIPPDAVEAPHARTPESVLEALASPPGGLGEAEAASRLARFGPNRLPRPPRPGPLRRFLRHFHDRLIYVLIGAGLITAWLGHGVDSGVIFGVVFVNAIIGFLQEGKSEAALEGIRRMLSLHAQVRRDGAWREIEAEELVPGDRVRLQSGDRVPADLRILEAMNLRIEESALTGESEPVRKSPAGAPAASGLGDRPGMAYSGTLVAVGRGIGVVTGTGGATEIGRINRMLAEVRKVATPLTRQMDAFGRTLSIVILALAGLMFLAGRWLHDAPAPELFFAAIGFAVAAIPEGLPAVMTITLALGVERMSRRRAITRKLSAVETLGSVTVICSDKTGTLTRNEMTARHLVTRAGRYEIEGVGYAPQGRVLRDGVPAPLREHPDLSDLVEVAALCNDADLVEREGQWTVNGAPTEGALLALARKAGFDRAEGGRLAVLPFESENKFMATLNRDAAGAVRLLVKGAPDRLLDRCSLQRGGGGAGEPLDRGFWEGEMERLAAGGLRVLAAAARPADGEPGELRPGDLGRGLVFLGLVGIQDPPRPDAIQAIRVCREAGIRVLMITGDHARTAEAIGREMGLGGGAPAVSGEEIEAASDAELRQMVRGRDLFARTSPEHKLRLVTALQANGEVVAMTGDGVNDAPALRRADVGVAMGIKGTEATKEAADIVLADDNFTTIERAVEEGRTIYDNLRKAILFVLPTNGAEALVMLSAVLIGGVLPLIPVQILWVNMVTAVTLALALAFEPPEPDLMRRPPRRPGAPILDRMLLWRVGFVSALIGGATLAVFFLELRLGEPLERARTLAVNTLVFCQAFYLFNSRFLKAPAARLRALTSNRAAILALAALAALQLAYVYAPLMHRLFGSAPLSPRHWLAPFGAGLGVFALVEAEKALLRRRGSLRDRGVSPSARRTAR